MTRCARWPGAVLGARAAPALLLAALAAAPLPRGAGAQTAAHPFGDPAVRHWPPTRTYHVLDYRLALRFDEPAGEVFGSEVVTLRPFEPHFRRFYLNSSGLTIESVRLERDGTGAEAVHLSYAREDPRLWITLDRDYGPGDTLRVRIAWHGHPRTGLFFVNPTASYPRWPREVFSQGEPELNHYWFPCWDYPNDMATSETVTTVPVGQRVVSNGRLVRVTRDGNDVTYDWVEHVPHSSYLISIAVGPWRRIHDTYGHIPVDYYVPPYVSVRRARRSFGLTPDMIGFFSRATGVEYPYEQYAQTAVHNFVFGGQENVSATTLTESTLHDARADADYPSTDLVAHELGQHWFGDDVQGGDWAEIWLNEGFATYLSALYTQYHDGNDAFRFRIYQDQMAAQEQDRRDYLRPIVDRHYADPLDMFDAITHEKGAAVLDMLRYVVDGAAAASRPASQREPLFRALHRYLVRHHARTADTDALIREIRASTGLELGWFFREWVYRAGYPRYHVEAAYDSAARVEHVTVAQTQRVDSAVPLFTMPVELAFFAPQGPPVDVQVWDSLRVQRFDVPLPVAPRWVDFDPHDFIDKALVFPRPLAALVAQAIDDPSMMSRLQAVQQLGADTGGDAGVRVAALARALGHDPFSGVRAAAATSLGVIGTEAAVSALQDALDGQRDSRVRAAAVRALRPFGTRPEVEAALRRTLRDDPSYAVQAAAAEAIGASGSAGAFDALRTEAARHPELRVMQGTLAGLAATKDPRAATMLLAMAQPGVPERLRLGALGDLIAIQGALERGHMPALTATVRAALADPFLLVRLAGERLAGAFDLAAFRADIARDLDAPLPFQRDAARDALRQLDEPAR